MILSYYYNDIRRKVNRTAKNYRNVFCFSPGCAILSGAIFSGKDLSNLKSIGRVILSAIFLVLTGLMIAFAKAAPAAVFAFYPALSRKMLAAVSSVSGLLPIALWEILAVLLALWFFYTLICVFTKHHSLLRWLSGVLLAACVGVFAFVGLWGLNHFAPSVGTSLGLDLREYSKEELITATSYYAAQTRQYAGSVERDADGLTVYPAFSQLAAKAADGYGALAAQYDAFDAVQGPVKPLASWKLFSKTGTTGIFVCFTAEACVNPDTYTAWIPYTMCHELAHKQAVAAEDEANFCAYLACMASDDVNFRYSGAFGAYIYCHNALSRVDKQAAAEIWATLPDGVVADIRAANAHYAQYEGTIQDAAQKVNDTYLKAFSEESGVQSYGEAADLLIAWYLKQAAA